MNGTALKILKEVSKLGELSLAKAIECGGSRHDSHIDQYPLALLLEEHYLGMSITNQSPPGFENMREFELAVHLHMYRLPKSKEGETHYLGVVSRGSINPNDERVFLKAKGALYLDEQSKKSRDRLYSFLTGVAAGLLVALGSAWIKSAFALALAAP